MHFEMWPGPMARGCVVREPENELQPTTAEFAPQAAI